jgi:hypothetical protein
MYALARNLTGRATALREASSFTVALVLAELFYKFHSFSLECLAFLATWTALAVNSAGKVGLLYQQLTGSGDSTRWVTHFRTTTDGQNWDDLVLANTPANVPVKTFDPYLGDYADLVAVGPDFYGVFCANNTPDLANFPNGVTYQRNADFGRHILLALDNITPVAVSIDPFFFRVAG